MTYEPVGYTILSPARWGRNLLNAVKESPKLRFKGVWSRSADNAADIVSHYGGQSYPNYEAILADPAVEAVLLPTPHFLHHPQAMAAFAAGKHVFVEKPIANSLAEAREMQQASEAHRRVLAVGHQGRRTGAVRKARKMLEQGDLGQVATAVAVHGFPNALKYAAGDWEASPELCPGGPLDQLGVHYMDTMQYLLGPIRRVSGFTTNHVTPFPMIDAATAILEFPNHILGVYTTHFVSAGVSQLALYGTRGALHIHRFGQDLFWQELVETQTAKTAGPQYQPLPFDGPQPFTTALTEELEEFADCIRLGGRPEVGAPEGMAALRAVRAVMEAMQSGCAVDLVANTPGGA